ncbi:hypothetical protein ACLNBX_10295, partial [Streptococcus pneumoniae]|uniref:hypothetical protein n=1 Tax=Streptococcus pneumoniae TaxID=1313 RepID=UPI00398F8472
HLVAARHAKEDEDGKTILSFGSPIRDGGIVLVKLDWLARQAMSQIDQITKRELLETMERFGMAQKIMGPSKTRTRWWT